MEDYFDAIASAVDIKIYLYNYPECTGYDLSADLMLRLRRKHDNIVGQGYGCEFCSYRKIIDTILTGVSDFEVYSS